MDMKNNKIIKKALIGGVNNPVLTVEGVFDNTSSKLAFFADGKKITNVEFVSDELLNYEYRVLLPKDSKTIEIFLVHHKEKEL